MTTSTVPSPAEHPELIELGRRPSLRTYGRQIWERREFALTIPMGELRAQHMNTALGSIWHLLNPLLLAGVYYLVFGIILRDERGGGNFLAYLVTGLFVFYFTQKALVSGSRMVITSLPLIQSMSFPRIVLPIAAVIGEAVAQIPAIIAMVVIVVLTGESPHIVWLLVIPLYLLQCVFNLGIAFVAARLTFHFHDTQQLLPFLIRIWLYLSGIFYTVDRVPEGWPRMLFEANPLYPFITATRALLIDAEFLPAMWAQAAGWAIAAFIVGFSFFRAKEGEYGRGY